MQTGTVKWFNERKGFGFITQSDGTDIFVHYSQIKAKKRSLDAGKRVLFNVVETQKGKQASDVQKLADDSQQASEGITT